MLYLVDKVIHTGNLTQIGQESENLEFDNHDHCSEDALRDESYDNDANNKDDNNDVNNVMMMVVILLFVLIILGTRSLFEVSPGRLSLAVAPAEYIYFLFLGFCFNLF